MNGWYHFWIVGRWPSPGCYTSEFCAHAVNDVACLQLLSPPGTKGVMGVFTIMPVVVSSCVMWAQTVEAPGGGQGHHFVIDPFPHVKHVRLHIDTPCTHHLMLCCMHSCHDIGDQPAGRDE